MTALNIPCECGCGLMRRDSSKYASAKCADRADNQRRRERGKPDLRPSHQPEARRKYYAEHPEILEQKREYNRKRSKHYEKREDVIDRKRVTVIYPDCAEPDRMSKTCYERYRLGFTPDCRVFIDGVEL